MKSERKATPLHITGTTIIDNLPSSFKKKNELKKLLLDFQNLILVPITKMYLLKSSISSEKWIEEKETSNQYFGQISPETKQKHGLGQLITKNGNFEYGMFKNDKLKIGCKIHFKQKLIIYLDGTEDTLIIYFKNNRAFKGKVTDNMPDGFGVLYDCDILNIEENQKGKAYKFIGRFDKGRKRGKFTVKYYLSKKVRIMRYRENSEKEELDFTTFENKSEITDESEEVQKIFDFEVKLEEDLMYNNEIEEEEKKIRKNYEKLIEKYDQIGLFCIKKFNFDEVSSDSDKELAIVEDYEQKVIQSKVKLKKKYKEKFNKDLGLIEYSYNNFILKNIYYDSNEEFPLISPEGKMIIPKLIFTKNKAKDHKDNEIEVSEFFFQKNNIKDFWDYNKNNPTIFQKLDDFFQNYIKHSGINFGDLSKFEGYAAFFINLDRKKRLILSLKIRNEIEENSYLIYSDDPDQTIIAKSNQQYKFEGKWISKIQKSEFSGIFIFSPKLETITFLEGKIQSYCYNYKVKFKRRITKDKDFYFEIKSISGEIKIGEIFYSMEFEENEKKELYGKIVDKEENKIIYQDVIKHNFLSEKNDQTCMIFSKVLNTENFIENFNLVIIEDIYFKKKKIGKTKVFEGQILSILPTKNGESGIFSYEIPLKKIDATVVNLTKNTSYSLKYDFFTESYQLEDVMFDFKYFKAKFFDIESFLFDERNCNFDIGYYFYVKNPNFEMNFGDKIKVRKYKYSTFKHKPSNYHGICRPEKVEIINDGVKNYLRKFFNIKLDIYNPLDDLDFLVDYRKCKEIKLFVKRKFDNFETETPQNGIIFHQDGGITLTNLKENNYELIENEKLSKKLYSRGVYNNIISIQGRMRGNFIFKESNIIYQNGACYEGNCYFDRRHGKGELLFVNREKYDGDFFDGFKHGYGIYNWPNGDEYEGMFAFGVFNGEGRLSLSNGDILEGRWVDGSLVEGRVFSDCGQKFVDVKDGKIIVLID